MRQIGLEEVQARLVSAFAAGLQKTYGPDLGVLCREVIMYRPRLMLDEAALKQCVAIDSTPVLKAIVTNTISGATLRGFRTLMIGEALLADEDAVVRWATEGLNRHADCVGEWPASTAQWQVVLRDPDQFIQLARQIKFFLNQL